MSRPGSLPLTGRRRNHAWWLVLLIVGFGATSGCTLNSGAPRNRHVTAIGVHVVPPGQRSRVAELSGTTLSGVPFKLTDHLGGSLVLVNVWASWCGPCRQEMPILARAAGGHGSALRVLGIDERDSDSSARRFASSLGATYPSLIDHHSRLLMTLPMVPHNAIPSSVVIDGDGRVAAWVVGPVTSPELTSVISRIRATS